MSEKRFILAEDSNGLYSIFDTEDKEDEPLIYGARFGTEKIVDLLNTQQSKIDDLNYVNEQLRKDKAQLKERLRECRIRLDKFNCR